MNAPGVSAAGAAGRAALDAAPPDDTRRHGFMGDPGFVARWTAALRRVWLSPATLVLILVAGCALRVVQYALHRSLWLDESRLAMNILRRDYLQLLEPLDFRQAAPTLFLWATEALTRLAGTSEWVLRLIPFAAGLTALFLFHRLAREFLSAAAARLALLFLAVAPPAVRYASEFKQYSLDLLATVLILSLALALRRAHYAPKAALLAGLAGAVLVWCSHAAIFVLAGVGVAMLLDVLMGTRALRVRGVVSLAACGGLWLASFGWSYFTVVRASQTDFFYHYWKDYLAPFPPRTKADWLWYPETLGAVIENPLGFLFPAWIVVLGVAGAVSFWRRRAKIYLGLVLWPTVLVAGAALARAYPLADRLVLFVAPLGYLLIAAGVSSIAQAFPLRGATRVLVLLPVLCGLAWGDVKLFLRPAPMEENRPVIAYYLANRREADATYVYYDGEPSFLYYTRHQPAPLPYLLGVRSRDNPAAYLEEIDGLAGRGRMWFYFSHPVRKEDRLMLARLDKIGARVQSYERTGSAVYLYDLRASPPPAPPGD